uniref:BZIP domain-containing protein n=1 Tax=Parastrongyloides trichosuri TaxID=131310 RepID=A0A0N4ZQ55_PARTI
MKRTFVPEWQKDEAYYKKRLSNAASVKLFRMRKKKVEEEHNQKILLFKEKLVQFTNNIDKIRASFQIKLSTLNYEYMNALNTMCDMWHQEITIQFKELYNIANDIPEFKTRNYGFKSNCKNNNVVEIPERKIIKGKNDCKCNDIFL